ncbi:MAG: V-type ATPase subunit [Hespellia sp.]|nr:V-type ATPase subunit [Hespellia sp.]
MTDTKYTYAVARIRSLEVALFSNATIDQLMACKTYEECLQFITDKGWGDSDTPMNAEAVLCREEEKIWEVMREMRIDMSVFDVLSYPNQFHNLKAAIKEVCTEMENPGIFYDDCEIDGEEMLEIIRNKDFIRLPDNMQAAAKAAYESLIHTRDGQLCDVIIDRAAMEAIYQAGRQAKDDIMKNYAEDTVAIADIKIAVRSAKTAKSMEFMRRAMAECESLSVDQLSKAALAGEDAIAEYLLGTAYAGGAEALKESPSAFERWCDNRVIQTIQPQKYKAFTIGPLVAYVLARQNEIKTVRIILSGKQNGFPDDAIRERVREMYV